MAPSELLTERVRAAVAQARQVSERKMFGGITFMVKGKMCISVGNHRLMCRIDPGRTRSGDKAQGCWDGPDERASVPWPCLRARGSGRFKESP